MGEPPAQDSDDDDDDHNFRVGIRVRDLVVQEDKRRPQRGGPPKREERTS